MSDWFTARELAALPGMPATHSAVIRRARREGWTTRIRYGRGGGNEYALASLPMATRTALLRKTVEAHAPVQQDRKREADDAEELWTWFERRAGSVQDRARFRLRVLVAVERLMETGVGKTIAVERVANEFDVGPASIHAWFALVKGADRGVWLPKLAPAYTGRSTTKDICDGAWDFFKALYLTAERRSITHCYNLTVEAAAEHGWSVPSLRTVTRRAQAIAPDVRILMREGEAALVETTMPPQQRTVAHLYAMNWLSGDGYTHNVRVHLPSGVVGRPKTWFWQDVYSRRIVGYQADESENADQIRRALGRVIEQYGIPEHITIDNTRAAANKPMTGRTDHRHRFTARSDDAIGVIPQLGIQVHWTSINAGKGHGQAKPVERAFGVGGLGEYVDKHPRLAGAWTGPNTQEKPHNHGERVLSWDEFTAALEDGVRRWNALGGRRTEVCAGRRSFDEAFRESFEASADRIRKPTHAQRRLWLLPAENVSVKRDGSIVLRAGEGPQGRNRYSAESLSALAGKKVVVRFDPDALHDPVHVYELAGRYVGEAECIQPTGYGDIEGGKRYGRDKKRRTRAAREKAEIELRMDQAEAAELLPGAPEPEAPETNVVRAAFAPRMEEEAEEVDNEARFQKVVGRAWEKWRQNQL